MKVDSLKNDARSYEEHTGECSGTQTSKDVIIRKLRDDLELSEKQRKELLSSLEESENFIARLQGEMGRLENDNYISSSEANSKTLAIKNWENNFRESKLEVCMQGRGQLNAFICTAFYALLPNIPNQFTVRFP